MSLTTQVDTTATVTRPDRRRLRPGPSADRAGSESRHRRGITRWVVLALLGLAMLGTLFPFAIAAINAIKTIEDYTARGPLALPNSFDLTAMGGGSVLLVAPTRLSIDGGVAQQRTLAVTTLKLSFVPEPGAWLLLAAGALALGRVRGFRPRG